MIGQLELLTQLYSYKPTTFPHAILFIGDKGCGKHTLANELSNRYQLEFLDMTESISLDTINKATINLIPTLYFIDLDKVTEKQQNVILKFLEEPSENAYIVLISTVRSLVLDTVYNRCLVFEFKPYTTEELMQFVPKGVDASLVLKYCHTPGQVRDIKSDNLNKLVELCDKIITVLDKTNFSNLFKLVENIKSQDVHLFYNVLLDAIYNKYVITGDVRLIKLYNLVEDSLHKLMDSRYDVESLILSLVIEMWEASRTK